MGDPLRVPAIEPPCVQVVRRYNGTVEDSRADWSAGLEERSRLRRERLVAHRATDHQDAEDWDLDFWQSRTPEERLSALVAIRRDVEVVEASRERREP